MNSATVFQIFVTVLLWAATVLFFMGHGKLLGVGYNMLPIKGKESMREESEIKLQCRFIAFMVLLPLSIIFTVLTIGELLKAAWWLWIVSMPWLGVLFFIGLFIYIFFIVHCINSGKYKRQGK